MKAENLNLTDYLNILKPYIPKNIISPKNYNEILRIASFFPPGITSYIGFETRLTKKNTPTDLLFAVSKNKEREIFVNSKKSLLKAFSYDETWIRIFNFAKKWQEKRYSEKILGVWLEFDLNTFLQNIPIPNIFMHINPIYKSNANISWIMRDIFPILTNYDMPKKIEKTFNKCIKALPEKASIFQVATMINRAIEGIRVVVKRIGANDITTYLKSIGEALSKLLTPKFSYSILIGRRREKLEELKKKIEGNFEITTELKTQIADVVITATNHPSALLSSSHLKKNAIVIDVAQPPNVSASLCKQRPDIIRIDGGIVTFPSKICIPSMPKGKIFACIAEVIMQAMENNRANYVGSISLEHLKKTKNWAKKYGYTLDELTNFGKAI